MHNKAVNFISEGAAQTIGFVVRRATSFLGSLWLLKSASDFGFEYNYFAVFALFAIGYTVGVVCELIVRVITAFRHDS